MWVEEATPLRIFGMARGCYVIAITYAGILLRKKERL
jgi:hypothetical protein